MNENKPKVQMKDWYLSHLDTRLNGLVYGHPGFDDGTSVITSSIQNITKTEDAWIIETHNTIYICKFEDEF